MTKLNIRMLAEAAGIRNPLGLSKESGLAYAMCHKLWNDQQTRIDLTTIDRLCNVLRCPPGDLFVRDAMSPLLQRPPTSKGDHSSVSSTLAVGTVKSHCRRIQWID